jgi:hypothetical protein
MTATDSGPAPTESPPADDVAAIGWWRALATGIAVLVVGFAGAVLGANAILTKSLALTRTAREWLATALFFVVIALLAAVLRWLQHRRLI